MKNSSRKEKVADGTDLAKRSLMSEMKAKPRRGM
jgi:hypothetical protein